MRSRLIFYIPLALFCVISIYLGIGLTLDPKKLPNMLDGRPVPVFKLPPIKNRDDNDNNDDDDPDPKAPMSAYGEVEKRNVS